MATLNNAVLINHPLLYLNITHLGKGGQISRMPSLFRRVPDRMEQFTKVTSICQEFCSATDDNFSVQWMLYSAKKYKLIGTTLAELCDHNASVAAELGRYEVCFQYINLNKCLHAHTHICTLMQKFVVYLSNNTLTI